MCLHESQTHVSPVKSRVFAQTRQVFLGDNQIVKDNYLIVRLIVTTRVRTEEPKNFKNRYALSTLLISFLSNITNFNTRPNVKCHPTVI